MPHVYINNRFTPKAQACIPLDDRGFRFGDGVFETIRVVEGVAYQWEFHLSRLQIGLKALRIVYDAGSLHGICQELLKKNQCHEGFLRIAISRGVGSLGYLPKASVPTVVVETLPAVIPPEKPVVLWQSSLIKPSPHALPVGCKTMQGLNSTLARMEAEENGCYEALLLSHNGQVCEGSSSNIFWVQDNTLFTPSVEAGILPGSIRAAVIRLSPLPVRQAMFTLSELETAEEVFLTNAAWLVVPVKALQPQGFSWHTHNVTKQFQQLIQDDIARYARNPPR